MKNFLWKIYISRFMDSFILIGVIFALFFSNHGLDPFQISLLISFWSLTTILTEVPFGVLADTYSRKNLLILGLVLRAIGFGFWMMGGFVNYAIGFVLWGLKNTLTSGTLEGLVYDELAYYKKEDLYEEVSGKMGSAFSLGLFLSAIFGGLVAQISFSWVLVASIITSLLGALILSTLKSVKAVQSTGEVNYYQTLRNAVLEIRTNSTILYVIAFICIIFAAFGAMDEYWALIYNHFNLSESIVGVLVALVYGIGMVAGSTVKFFGKGKYLGYILISIGSVIYLLLGLTKMLNKKHEILHEFVKKPWKKLTFKEVKALSGKKSESYIYNCLKGFVRQNIFHAEVVIYVIAVLGFDSIYLCEERKGVYEIEMEYKWS